MNKIKEYRLLRGMSQYKLADLSGSARSHISEIENGKRKLTLKRARVFAEILNVDPFELLSTDAIKYNGDFEQTLKALIDSYFDTVVEFTQSEELPENTWNLYWIIFDILSYKFSDEDISVIRSVVSSLKQKYEAR